MSSNVEVVDRSLCCSLKMSFSFNEADTCRTEGISSCLGVLLLDPEVGSQQCWCGRCCFLRAASLCPTAKLKKWQRTDRNKQEHMSNCWIALSCAAQETVLWTQNYLLILHPFSLHPWMAREAGACANCTQELQMLEFACELPWKMSWFLNPISAIISSFSWSIFL